MNWRHLCACAIGTSHVSSGTPCQDSCLVISATDRQGASFLIALAADGAGSATFSEEGAELTCEVAGRFFCDHIEKTENPALSTDLAFQCLEQVRDAIFTAANAHQSVPREYACTLVGCVVGATEALAFQIGDGALVFRSDVGLYPIFWPDAGEYANMTYFVTDENAEKRLQVAVVQAPNEIAVLTDGLQRLALVFATREVHAPFFESMFKVLRGANTDECDDLTHHLVQFLDSSEVNQRTDDDKTLILATRLTGTENEQVAL
ncbi:PP2C family serine/threonine-protein phosphatase [Collimonas pratensis]|uniref:PP2C family serine/threonine-protein phosphatase n=1 Tax=Collimonas pratensis TaxID=279113 RepID=UPI000783F24F|nr:PP2C family serine/threonine-protein phosphatase [Collimonas pratensis]